MQGIEQLIKQGTWWSKEGESSSKREDIKSEGGEEIERGRVGKKSKERRQEMKW